MAGVTGVGPATAPPATVTRTPSPTRLKTTATPSATPPVDWAQIHSGLTVLYWNRGDLWRTTVDGQQSERLTRGELLDDWFSTEGDDPWWIGGPQPQPYVSPDGRWLVASSRGQQLVIVDLSDAQPLRRLPSSTSSVSWSPDSRFIAYGRDRVDIFDVATGESLEVPERRPGDIEDIVWSPDGQEVAYACCFQPDDRQAGEETGRIFRYDVSTGVAESVGETWRGLASGTPGLCWSDGRPIPAEKAVDQDHCSPRRILPFADSVDGLLRAELTGYLSEQNVFSQVSVIDLGSGLERFRLDLSGKEPTLDLRRVFWTDDSQALLLGSYSPGEAIYRWFPGEDVNLEPVVADGVLYGVLPQWQLHQPAG